MRRYFIGELAKRASVKVDTIRYYEKQGLMPRPFRSESGYRLYTPEDLRRIIFIRAAKRLGFSLKEIKDLLSLRINSQGRCRDVKRISTIKISEIEKRIESLQGMMRALIKLVAACREGRKTSLCPILDAIDHGNI